MGKETILAQFFKAIIREIWSWKPPPRNWLSTKEKNIFEMSEDVPNHSPHAGKKLTLPTAAWIVLSQLGSLV